LRCALLAVAAAGIGTAAARDTGDFDAFSAVVTASVCVHIVVPSSSEAIGTNSFMSGSFADASALPPLSVSAARPARLVRPP
jgi:hypothetical protein